MDVTVFYAWQDDRPGKLNRYLIRDAANDACQRISDDPGNDFTVHLDQDTKGRPGMCDIPNTILEKIRECDVLLADLTFVGTTDPEVTPRKQIPNPNVLMELGYAVGCKATDESDGFERVIGVMNVAYGKPEEQMFDIKRRRPICYELPQDSGKDEIQRARKSLGKHIEAALRTILGEAVLPGKGEIGAQRFQEIRDQFEASVRDGSFHGIYHDCGAIAICLAPDVSASLDYSTLREQHLPPLGCSSWNFEPRGKSVLSVHKCKDPSDPTGEHIRCSITEVSVEGIILGADTFALNPAMHPHAEHLGEIIPSMAFERAVVQSVSRYAEALHRLDVSLPWRLGVSLLGIRGHQMLASQVDMGRVLDDKDNLTADPILICDFEDVNGSKSVARFLRRCFDYFWRECGFGGSWNYGPEGNWKGPWW